MKKQQQQQYSQTVQNQHKTYDQIVNKEVVTVSQKSAGQSLKIGYRFEIVEIEKFRPWSHILPYKCP